ncbi:UDP-N-acetyl-D-galactosamine dehydrogenase, partial [Williamwhitmania taraxaci]
HSFGVLNVDVIDAFADAHEVHEEYGITMATEPTGLYDAILVAVSHQQYVGLTEEWFKKYAASGCVFVDVKGIFKNKVNSFTYWSL